MKEFITKGRGSRSMIIKNARAKRAKICDKGEKGEESAYSTSVKVDQLGFLRVEDEYQRLTSRCCECDSVDRCCHLPPRRT